MIRIYSEEGAGLQTIRGWGLQFVLFAASLYLIVLIVTSRELPKLGGDWLTGIGSFKTVFLSIVLEAIPFILLGVLVSALLQVFVSEDTIRRWVPRNPVLGLIFGCLLGVLFPLCECGMIPVVRRLIRKGMPAFIGVVFILAGPIINPVVYASTYMAFRSRPELVYSRMGLAFAVAAVVGLAVWKFVRTSPLREQNRRDHDHHHHHEHGHAGAGGVGGKLASTLSHASDEFFEMGKYLLFGSLLTAVIQTTVTRESLVAVGQDPWLSHLFMMGFAYILSICSTSDAFVASSFATTFSMGSLLTFLVFGPMLDLKNTLMMLSVFRARFVLLLIALVSAAVLAGSLVTERLYLG